MINKTWRNLFDHRILQRGENYALEGAVEELRITQDAISAVVCGSEDYKVKIDLNDGKLEGASCTCPYARGGSLCKHIAAVLFVSEDADDKKLIDPPDPDSQSASIADLLSNLSHEELVHFVEELAEGNDQIANLIRVRFSHSLSSADLKKLKREADHIFTSHQNRGFIDYHEAMDFSIDICLFLDEKVGGLVENRHYMEAFELSTYIFIKLSDTAIDDDGEITEISEACYEIWKQVISSCSKEQYDQIYNWFTKHSDDGTVVDYMEDVLQEFLENELATDDDLRQRMQELDAEIEAAKGSSKCPSVWSAISYSQPAVFTRMDLMKRLGATDEEI